MYTYMFGIYIHRHSKGSAFVSGGLEPSGGSRS